MALRSPSRTATATSGPGRGPVSDSRTRHRHHRRRSRSRRREASAEALRLRAETLFAERRRVRGELRHGPPVVSGREGWSRGRGGVVTDVGTDAETGVESGAEVGAETGAGVDVEIEAVGARVRARGEAGAGAGAGADSGARAGALWRERTGLAVRERMPLWLQSRCGLERRSVVALTVVLVVAAVFAAQHFWAGRTQPVRAPEVVRAVGSYGGDGEGGQEAAPGSSAAARDPVGVAGAAGAAAGAVIVVDVSGKVREPGIQRLPAGSRVADALRAAGGVRPGTDTEGLNRARLLVDGEQVVVGGPPAVAGPGVAGGPGAAGSGGAAAGAAATPVGLNTATLEQLDTLPGVGPVLAQHIIDYRTQHGGFRSVDELREVNGIGDPTCRR
ncbi:ComEA family DNA-binding protein [Streptomyces sp. NBC_00258]|uniref:ComEA family DNA-binding protein n=1 Tax=Streptomyces sp. NBC_00258 TaxID=2903642 RepID=UPI002E2C5E45|nr:ComEA family DNA-binding protein [Streptomyces sp. NBC_00258]